MNIKMLQLLLSARGKHREQAMRTGDNHDYEKSDNLEGNPRGGISGGFRKYVAWTA